MLKTLCSVSIFTVLVKSINIPIVWLRNVKLCMETEGPREVQSHIFVVLLLASKWKWSSDFFALLLTLSYSVLNSCADVTAGVNQDLFVFAGCYHRLSACSTLATMNGPLQRCGWEIKCVVLLDSSTTGLCSPVLPQLPTYRNVNRLNRFVINLLSVFPTIFVLSY